MNEEINGFPALEFNGFSLLPVGGFIFLRDGNFYFIKGTLLNQEKRNQCMNGPTILDGLHNSRCGSFCCVCVMQRLQKSAWINIQGFHHVRPL